MKEEKNVPDDPRSVYFDQLAATWDAKGPPAHLSMRKCQDSKDLLNLTPGQNLLEVGCGTGGLTDYLVKAVSPGRVTAVDFSTEMIQAARAKGIDADFRCLDICSQDPPSLYDVVLCFNCVPHFRDQAAALRRLRAALEPGGRLIVMHHAGSVAINNFHAQLSEPVRNDRLPIGEQWNPLLEQAGLTATTHIDRDDLFLLITEPTAG